MRRQALGLGDVEHGVGPQQRIHLLRQGRWLVLAVGMGLGCDADAAQLPEHDRAALLALADVATQLTAPGRRSASD